MNRTDWKQTWAMVKQNKLFTAIYVGGTAIAIATMMVATIVYYVKIAPIYPETNRDRTLYFTTFSAKHKDPEYLNQWAFSYLAVKEWFYSLKNVEAVSATSSDVFTHDYVQPTDGSGDFEVRVEYTDPAFFQIYTFQFIEGKPFTEADLTSGLRSMVISDALARRLFGTDRGLVGQHFSLNDTDCRIVGVVKSASWLTQQSYAQVYAPYSVQSGYDAVINDPPQFGGFKIKMLVRDAVQEQALRREFAELVRKYNASSEDWAFDPGHQPYDHLTSVFHVNDMQSFSWGDVVRRYIGIFVVLLLVPALNLSGMIAGRMESRLPEMGIRKSFGASRGALLGQVMRENLLLTLAGGVLGLMLSWLMLVTCRNWIFALFDADPRVMLPGTEATVSGEMLLAPAVFIVAFLVCVALNLLSALLPALHSLRNPIVQSLNEKR